MGPYGPMLRCGDCAEGACYTRCLARVLAMLTPNRAAAARSVLLVMAASDPGDDLGVLRKAMDMAKMADLVQLQRT